MGMVGVMREVVEREGVGDCYGWRVQKGRV